MSITQRIIELADKYRKVDDDVSATSVTLQYFRSQAFFYNVFGRSYIGRESRIKALAFRTVEESMKEKYYGEFGDIYRKTK